MYIKQFYTNCLAEAAYYIESNGEAVVIDPLRETKPYIELANKRDAKIKFVFETHFHADFISGHIDLANETGADIVFGPSAKADYPIYVANDSELFSVGDVKIKVLHTPGHTMESSCFLLINKEDKDYALFSGDTLFIGDVGRPDLAVKSDLSKEDLAGHLYDSIFNKIMPLNDSVIVYPGHGAGSQCGKKLSSDKYSTIGEQKKDNYALLVSDKKEFVNVVTSGLTPPPQYFPKNATINKTGYSSINSVIEKSNNALGIDEFKSLSNKSNVIIIDSRISTDFADGHIPNSINIGLNGFFAVWVGTLIKDLNTPILLVTSQDKEEETILRLARVGYENVLGFLKDRIDYWGSMGNKIIKASTICPIKFNGLSNKNNIIDVSTINEYINGHVNGAVNLPLSDLLDNLSKISKDAPYYIYCKSGYRSMIALSFLERNGFDKITNINKGYDGVLASEDSCTCSNA